MQCDALSDTCVLSIVQPFCSHFRGINLIIAHKKELSVDAFCRGLGWSFHLKMAEKQFNTHPGASKMNRFAHSGLRWTVR